MAWTEETLCLGRSREIGIRHAAACGDVCVFGNPERFKAACFEFARQVVGAYRVIGIKHASAVKHNYLLSSNVRAQG
jgi:hypothetical protein